MAITLPTTKISPLVAGSFTAMANIMVVFFTVLRKNSSLLKSLTLQDFSDLIFNHYGDDMYISSIHVFDVQKAEFPSHY
jgi:hypothetical protein